MLIRILTTHKLDPNLNLTLAPHYYLLLGPYVLGQFLNSTVLVFATLLVPLIPACHGSGGKAAAPFWETYLPTVILAGCNIFGFGGRLAVSMWRHSLMEHPLMLLFGMGLSAGLAALVLNYQQTGWGGVCEDYGNTPIISLYLCFATLCGINVVALSQTSQTQCKHSIDAICPVAAQVTEYWVADGGMVEHLAWFFSSPFVNSPVTSSPNLRFNPCLTPPPPKKKLSTLRPLYLPPPPRSPLPSHFFLSSLGAGWSSAALRACCWSSLPCEGVPCARGCCYALFPLDVLLMCSKRGCRPPTGRPNAPCASSAWPGLANSRSASAKSAICM